MNLRRINLQPLNSIIFRQVRLSCWSCGSDAKTLVSNLFCAKCSALQDPGKQKNYFSVLGVKENYDLNESVLSKRYKDLQKFLHPDKFTNRHQKEQEISAKYSSLVNEAYKTLLEPLSRGIYLLQIKGRSLPEETEMLDQKFLMEIMEKNEEVENADTEEEIMKLKRENREKMEELQQQISKAFHSGDLERATKLLSIMKYYTSIENQIQDLIRSKGIVQ